MNKINEEMENIMEEDCAIEEEHKRGRRRGKEESVLGGVNSGKKIVSKLGPGRPRKQNTAPLDPASSLYEIVKQGRTSFQTVVDEWIESYKKDKMTAVLNLMQFFVDSSGCKGKITGDMLTTMEHSDIIRRMTEQFDEESGDYPIISGGVHKRFRINFCDFIGILIKQCQYSIIFDPYVIDNILHFLIGLADSQVRAFRHTSTLGALKIMTALVEVILNININLEYTLRQFETEKQKCHGKRPTERMEMLTQKKLEIEENMNDVCTQLTYIFRSIFVHRYRDTIPDVRAMCMQEIGIWMKKFPKMFLDDSYLKYIGWTLYDKVGEVRLKCLLSLQPLYSCEELTTRLELFTNKFKDRIIAMTLDKEYEVAVQAVRLVNSILKHHRDILTDRDCEHVYELVYSIHRQVAQAAGEFLKERLFTLDEEALGRTVKSKRGKKRLPNTPLIRDLVQFFIESELHEHGAYLVDSLIETNEMMKDWECMTDLLLEEPGRGEEALDNQQETSLIEIMTCCVKQAATGEPPVGRTIAKKGHTSQKENKLLQEERLKLTQHFIVTLPSLIAKYIADPEKIANLMLIPQYFELDLYTTNRCEKYLDSLLKYSEEIMGKHLNADVLATTAKTYEYLCTVEHSTKARCLLSRSTLIDTLVERFKLTYDDFMQEKEEPDEDEIFGLLASVKRLSAFNEFHDMSPPVFTSAHLVSTVPTPAHSTVVNDLWDYFVTLLKHGCDTSRNYAIPHDILDKVATAAHYHLLWYLYNVSQAIASLRTSFDPNAVNASIDNAIANNNPGDGHVANGTFNGDPLLNTQNNFGALAGANNPEMILPQNLLDQMSLLKARLADYIAVGQELMYAGSFLEEDIYLSICDLLLAFNRHIAFTNPPLKHVIHEPDKNLITQLNSFVIEKVFVTATANPNEGNNPGAEAPEENETSGSNNPSTGTGQNKIEQLRKGRNFLASYCKLIIYNVISVQNAVDIFRNYTKFYTDYGDIIKMTIGKAREINKVSCAKVMITALQYHFKDIVKGAQFEFEGASQNSNLAPENVPANYTKTTVWHEGFASLKELGRRFCLSFGLDQIKNREAIALIHKEGILFSLSGSSNQQQWADHSGDPQQQATPPNHIHFLDVVAEFSNKLMRQDKRTVITFLDRHLPPGALNYRGEEWQPLFNYRNSLLQNIDNETYTKLKTPNNPTAQATPGIVVAPSNVVPTNTHHPRQGNVSGIPTNMAHHASTPILGQQQNQRQPIISNFSSAAPNVYDNSMSSDGMANETENVSHLPSYNMRRQPSHVMSNPNEPVLSAAAVARVGLGSSHGTTALNDGAVKGQPPNVVPGNQLFMGHGMSLHQSGQQQSSSELHPIYEHEEEMAEIGEKDLNMFLGSIQALENQQQAQHQQQQQHLLHQAHQQQYYPQQGGHPNYHQTGAGQTAAAAAHMAAAAFYHHHQTTSGGDLNMNAAFMNMNMSAAAVLGAAGPTPLVPVPPNNLQPPNPTNNPNSSRYMM